MGKQTIADWRRPRAFSLYMLRAVLNGRVDEGGELAAANLRICAKTRWR